ncbi:hypothetical protein ABOM_003287 [Aspergillus bombycis]|uniref:Azaphilone pigments biosynthesis cluster protein L N-terminal domain-containing protein n=1 Tax=Aspergillus bombycis TaxID=109264 RepID=A0A1F8A7Z6_9EURO|nr:hypothetical protein ABOM_003287 [Aspergillus bombycis]OGM47844.1 hypothetical protein ABOM_003287 [Aspergillus bombycis]
MADPLSIAASALAVITAAIQSTKSLVETVKRFKDRDKMLRRLQAELEDLTNILDALAHVTKTEKSMLALLRDPINRCQQVCCEFELSMKAFSEKSKIGFRDWAKMEFMRGDINDFIDTISGYKSTISVGLGTITMQTTQVSQKVLEEYNEMVQDTAYNLELYLRRIDDKLARISVDKTDTPGTNLDLEDEREVTKQCLWICQDAKSYIESLTNRESSLLQEAPSSTAEKDTQKLFEAQLLTRQALDTNRDNFARIIGHLGTRLETLVLDRDAGNDNDRLRLQEDINISMQCLEVCKVASELSSQKIYRVGEAVADGDSDQVVVTTLADLFDVKKALSTGNSAQLVGSMTDDSLRYVTEKRYGSRFGAVAGGPHDPAGATTTTRSPPAFEAQKSKPAFSPRPDNDEQSSGRETRRKGPSPNEMRKRMTGGNTDQDSSKGAGEV